MIRFSLRGLAGRKLRSVLTAFAIVLGVAMVSGSFILTDTIRASFDGLFSESYKNSAVIVSPKTAVGSVDGEHAEKPPFSESLLARIKRVPGVRAAAGGVSGTLRLVGKSGKPLGRDGTGLSVDASRDQSLNPLRLVRGRWPKGESEIAIDSSTAERQGLRIGDVVGAFADGPVRRYRLTGLVRFGSAGSVAGTTLAALDLRAAQHLFHKEGKLDEIQLAAAKGTSATELARRVRTALPPTVEATTAAAQAASDSNDLARGLKLFRYLLLAFGGIALFVGAFVIANTLGITVAQRTRELATLRTLGASRRQVLRSVVLEAGVIGLLASVVGLFLGLGTAQALRSLLAAIDLSLPAGGLVFAARTVVVSLVVGTLIAILAGLRPAMRATKVAPIAAVREGALLQTSSRRGRNALAAAAGLLVAVAMVGCGLFAHGVDPIGLRIAIVGTGILVLFVAISIVARRLVRPLATAVGAPGAWIGGPAARLARANAVRNPARTASTAAALMVGLTLITFVSVIAQGARASLTEAVNKQFKADYALAAGDGKLSDDAARAAARAPGVEVVSGVREGSGRLLGESVLVTGVDGAIAKVVRIDWRRGSNRVPAELGRSGAFVEKKYAESHRLHLGSALLLTVPSGRQLRLVVEGIFKEPRGGSPFGVVTISTPTFDRSFLDHDNAYTFVNMRGGVNPANTARLERALAAFPDADVQTREQFTHAQLSGLETVLNVVYALLALSVLVSLLGIVNTLVLSVFERTRELGLLRAIGMSRRQVRRMIRHEGVITTLIGATLGIGVGLLLAAAVTRALSHEGFVFAVPFGSLLAFVVLAIVLGLMAAILPARRASRLNILEALQYE